MTADWIGAYTCAYLLPLRLMGLNHIFNPKKERRGRKSDRKARGSKSSRKVRKSSKDGEKLKDVSVGAEISKTKGKENIRQRDYGEGKENVIVEKVWAGHKMNRSVLGDKKRNALGSDKSTTGAVTTFMQEEESDKKGSKSRSKVSKSKRESAGRITRPSSTPLKSSKSGLVLTDCDNTLRT